MTDANLPGAQDPTNPAPDNTGKNEDEVRFEDGELDLVGEDTSKKIQSLSAQKAHFRDKAAKLQQELAAIKAAAAAPAPSPAPAPAPSPMGQADPEEVARRVAMSMKLEEYLMDIPEDKRGTVKEFYSALTNGKKVDLNSFSSYLGAATRAAGIEQSSISSHRIASSASGAVPPASKPGPSKEQVDLATKAGHDPKEVYGDKIDFGNLLNAHKFVTPKSENII